MEWTLIAIRPTKLTELTNERMTMEANAEIVDLHSRIKKIYARVNLNVRVFVTTTCYFKFVFVF